MKYRKKPVVVEAFKLEGLKGHDIPKWFIDGVTRAEINISNLSEKSGFVVIRTLEGNMIADYGDYIIRGVKGEIYPCRPDIFEMTYESAEPESDKNEKSN